MIKINSQEEKNWSIGCHLGTILGFVIPFGHIVVTLVIWLSKKEESDFINLHGKESLNFQISITIYLIISTILAIVLIGFLLFFGIIIFDIVMVIKGSIAASEGKEFIYPYKFNLID